MKILDLLIKVEDSMDTMNGIHGEGDCLCIFCYANTYDGKSGIIHKEDCPVKLLREEIYSQSHGKVKA